MPRRPILPDSSTLRNLRASGHTHADIAKQYGVSVSAVHKKLNEYGLTSPRPSAGLPWRYAVEHKDDPLVEALRALARRERGEPLLPVKERALDRWLEERAEDGCVVDYDRERGFFLTKRKKRDGTGYMRRPKAAKESQPA